MDKSENEIALGFTNENFPKSCHVCLIYENEEHRAKIVSEYLAAGINHGELVRYFTDSTSPEEVRSWVSKPGVRLPEAEKNGTFIIRQAEEAYCPNGRFEPQEMINGTSLRYEQARKAGYTGMRSCGEMTWVFKNIPGSERWLEYEALLNTVKSSFPHTGMCQYDARRFDGATLFKILQVHPYIIAHGQIVTNPYYIRPGNYEQDEASAKNTHR